MASWDPNRDYATEIQEAILARRDPEYVKSLNDARNAKIAEMEQWNNLAGDKYAQAAERYYNSSGVNASAGYDASVNANNLATEQAIQNLEAQKPGINQAYDSLLRQNEINNRLEQENIRRGSIYGNYSSSGMPDTLKTAQSTAYQNLRNQSEQERQNALQDIENQKTNTRLTGDINAANMTADYYNNIANQAYQKELANQQHGWDVEARDFNANYNTAATDRQNAFSLITNGYYTPELAKQAGLSDEVARQIAADAKAAATVKTSYSGGSSSGGSSGGNGGTTKNPLTFAQAKSLLEEGNYSPNALAAYETATGQTWFDAKLSRGASDIADMLENARDNNGKAYPDRKIKEWIDSYYNNGAFTEEEYKMICYMFGV